MCGGGHHVLYLQKLMKSFEGQLDGGIEDGVEEVRESGGEERGEGGSDGHRKNTWYSEIINAKDKVVRYVRMKEKESF